MTDCTERHMAARAHDPAGEGQEGIPGRLSEAADRPRSRHWDHGAASTDGSVGPR
jgi:hypothetical protein